MINAIFLIVRKSLRQHAFSNTVTILSIALGAGLVMAVFAIQSQAKNAFAGGETGFDAVLGARGSQLQLVLNTVFHLETSPGNVPWSLYTELRDKTPGVKLAIPYATGDNYYGFRIVGTTRDIFTEPIFQRDTTFEVEAGGRFFDDGFREAVIGSTAAEQAGIQVGDTISPYHGIYYDETAKHPEEYTVVGILKPTNTPSDRVIWIPIEGIFRMEGHVLRAGGEEYVAEPGKGIPDEHKEVSAVMLKLASPTVGFQLAQMINKQGKVATLAFPIDTVILDVFNKMGWAHRVLALVAYLVVLVSAAAITTGIYNTLSERKREFAILRALGARRSTVFSAIVAEAGFLGLAGTIVGYAVYGVIFVVAAQMVRKETGVVLNTSDLHPALYLTPLLMIGTGAAAGLIPAFRAYRTDVAENLSPQT